MSLETIYHLSLELPRRNRALGALHGTDLTLFESHVLTELEINPDLDSAGLAALLVLNQSSISRIVKRLSKDGYLTVRKSSEDSRRIHFRPTAKAIRAIRKIDEAADEILAQLSQNVSVREREKLRHYFQRMSDGFAVPRGTLRKGEHPIRAEQRRIARWLKILHQGSARAVLSPTEHQVLRLLHERRKPLSPSEIADLLQLQQSALSVVLRALKQREMVIALQNESDKRGEFITLAESAMQSLTQHEALQLQSIREALQGFSAAELSEFARIYTQFLQLPGEGNELFEMRFSIKRLESDDARRNARRLFLEHLAAHSALVNAPEHIFDGESRSYGLFEGGDLKAAIQLRDGKEYAFFSLLTTNEFAFEKRFRDEVVV